MAKEKKKNIAALLKDIEDIVDKLESGEIDIDESIKYYEKGMAMVEECGEALKKSRLKIEKLKKNAKGRLETEDFEEDEEEEEEENGGSLF